MNSPFTQVVLILIIAYLFYLWFSDYRTNQAGKTQSGALPGAFPCNQNLIWLAVAGAFMLVAAETVGELALDISQEQSAITILFGLVTLASGFGEELVFRGYLVIQNKGKIVLWLSIWGFSLVFACAHPFLWSWEQGKVDFHMTEKAGFSTLIVFLNSLWFYFMRFNRANPSRSLWPCIAAHVASNLAVVLVKLFQGHVVGIV
ncbi:MAG: CPBP family intramembrane metalloprotease [Verrucomicrobiae bacterium]|nr:CPBP family intramembrane metalloprotease [Verrucomicrobiae bacterium]